jgi:hypothetical protein
MSTPRYEDLMREFFEAQPHWLTNNQNVYYISPYRAGEEPTLALSLAAERAFVRWAVDAGRLRHPERVQRFRILLGMEGPPADFQ